MSLAVPIEPKFVERVWGSTNLDPLFGQHAKRIGEVWFDADPLLIKFLFTTEALSVQVHPADEFAREHENGSCGKTEMWHILRADSGARIAAGFADALDLPQARRAVVDGTIERHLAWWDAHPGDTFLIPAGTVHALGPGLVVCEIQQRSDVTYRLYDYNRGRELHLEKGLAVSDLKPHPGRSPHVTLSEEALELTRCGYFVTERWQVSSPWTSDRDAVLIVLEGSCDLGPPGTVWRITAGCRITPEASTTFLRTWAPQRN